MKRKSWMVAATLLLLGAAARGEPQPLADREVRDAVARRLARDPLAEVSELRVMVHEGVLRLQGRAGSLRAARRAEWLAGLTRGVRAVVNEVLVDPPLVPDGEITEAIDDRLASEPALEGATIAVVVYRGEVTLAGRVRSFEERQLAEAIAAGVRGVRAIEDRLVLRRVLGRSDRELRSEVLARLHADARVEDDDISVEVSRGRVRLLGAAGSLAERTLASRASWVPGVQAVDGRGLRVDALAPQAPAASSRSVPRRPEDRAAEPLTNAAIARAVRTALSADPRTTGSALAITVTDGEVTLAGVLRTVAARSRAEELAAAVPGVRAVRSHLAVQPLRPVDDVALAGHLRLALASDPILVRRSLTFTIEEGQVTLGGEVEDEGERRLFEELASSIAGITRIVDDVHVRRPATIASDQAIALEVRDALRWSALVAEPDRIQVQVRGGVVTLSGPARSLAEQTAVTRAALQAGAGVVRARLEVTPGRPGVGERAAPPRGPARGLTRSSPSLRPRLAGTAPR